MTANVERLRILRDYLTAHPEQHDQSVYLSRGYVVPLYSATTLAALAQDCGTTGCAAGWAVLLFGDPAAVYEDGAIRTAPNQWRPPSVFAYARKLLELPAEQASTLFLDTASSRRGAIKLIDYLIEHPDASDSELRALLFGDDA